jgi:hypothetical protein
MPRRVWDRYFGFAITQEEYAELSETFAPGKKQFISIFDRDIFGSIEHVLERIAHSRA